MRTGAELAAIGMDWHDVAFVQLHLGHMDHFAAANEAYNRILPPVLSIHSRLPQSLCVASRRTSRA